jgi:hypothetical protein
LRWVGCESTEKSRINIGESIVIENPESKKQREIHVEDVCLAIQTGQLLPRLGEEHPEFLEATHVINGKTTLTVLSGAAQTYVLDIQKWIAALRSKDIQYIRPQDSIHLQAMKDLQKSMGDELKPMSPWTIYRAQKKIRSANGDISAIHPKFAMRGWTHLPPEAQIRVSRLHPIVDKKLNELIEQAIKNTPHKVRPFTIRNELRDHLEASAGDIKCEVGIVLPSHVTISKRISNSCSKYELDRRRSSPDAAKQLYRSVGARDAAERILEVAQFDDIDARVFLIDPDTERPWGTAYMTCGIDERSRSVLGATIGAEYRNTASALNTLYSSIRAKDMSASEFDWCKKSWPMHGLPGLAVLDNASYNKSDAFKLSLLSMGVDFALARPKTPTNKSAVEHFNYRFKHHFAADLAGACINKRDPDGAKRGMNTAKYTLEEFTQRAFKYICDEYHHQPMDEGFSPSEIWNSQVGIVDFRSPTPRDLNFIRYFQLEELTFRSSGGILRKKLRYCNSELDDLQRRIGWNAKVNIRVNPYSLADIYVEDAQMSRWFSVPCVECDKNYLHGLSDALHSLILSCTSAQKNELRIGGDWQFTGIDDMQDLAQKLCKNNSLTMRGNGFRIKTLLKNRISSSEHQNSNAVYKYSTPQRAVEAISPAPMLKAEVESVQTKKNPEFMKMLAMLTATGSATSGTGPGV